MNENKIAEKAMSAAAQIGAAIMFFFFAAATTATDPFFRKNMGERYLTLPKILISTFGWVAMVCAACAIGLIKENHIPRLPLISGIIIVVAYAFFAGVQYYVIIRKRQAGAYWHSRSRGESLFGRENRWRDLLIEIALVFALAVASPLYAHLFLVSRVLGYISDATARAMLYSKYLDIQDAKIEAQFMEVALRDGLAPGLTAGLSLRLPGSLKGEHRANVAKVVSEGMREIKGFRPPDEGQTPRATPKISRVQTNPLREDQRGFVSVAKKLIAGVSIILRSSRARASGAFSVYVQRLCDKRIRKIVVSVIVVIILIWAISSLRSHSKSSVASRVLKKSNPIQANTTAADTSSKRRENVALQPPPSTSLETGSVPDVLKDARALLSLPPSPSVQIAQPNPPVAPIQTSVAPASSEPPTMSRKLDERNKRLDQLQASVKTGRDQLARFGTNCNAQLQQIASKIEGLKRSQKKDFLARHSEMQKFAKDSMELQQSNFDTVETQLRLLIANSDSDPKPLTEDLPKLISEMEHYRNAVLTRLDTLESEVEQASGKSTFHMLRN